MLSETEEEKLTEHIKLLMSGQVLPWNEQLWLALELQASHVRTKRDVEGTKSNRPLEAIVINQAKKLMMVKYGWTEQQAHHYVHRAAMNNRTTKFQFAKKFIEKETQ